MDAEIKRSDGQIKKIKVQVTVEKTTHELPRCHAGEGVKLVRECKGEERGRLADREAYYCSADTSVSRSTQLVGKPFWGRVIMYLILLEGPRPKGNRPPLGLTHHAHLISPSIEDGNVLISMAGTPDAVDFWKANELMIIFSKTPSTTIRVIRMQM